MINLFKKKKINKNIYAPINGKCIDISEVKDNTFASKVMGDGFAVEPISDIVSSPCDGEITMIFPTKHAFGIKMQDDKEVLVHIGIDTVNLKGKGFTALRNKNDKVKAGDSIIKLDKSMIEKEYDLTVMVIITANNKENAIKRNLNEVVKTNELIMTFEWGGLGEANQKNQQ